MTAQSTIADGKAWFQRHHVPLAFDRREGQTQELKGGFNPLGSQGFWASWDVNVRLKFDASGTYQSSEVWINEFPL